LCLCFVLVWRRFAYIYFEELNTDRNFAENRDRCNTTLFLRPSLQELNSATADAETDLGDVGGGGSGGGAGGGGGTDGFGGEGGGAFASVEIIKFAVGARDDATEAVDTDTTKSSVALVVRVCPTWRKPSPDKWWTTSWKGDWKGLMLKWLEPEEESAKLANLHAFIIVSPPGAGKTHFISNVIETKLRDMVSK
jgi:hypothetical protein